MNEEYERAASETFDEYEGAREVVLRGAFSYTLLTYDPKEQADMRSAAKTLECLNLE